MQGVLHTIIVALLFFTNIFARYKRKIVNYSRYSMLDFPQFMAAPLAHYYLSAKDKQ